MTVTLSVSDRERLRAKALELGFVRAGVAAATDAETFGFLESWLDAGMHGEMGYMARRREARKHPKSLLKNVRSVWMVAWDSSHGHQSGGDADSKEGRIGRYAWGLDYHVDLKARLRLLAAWCHDQWPKMRTRGVVDTAPLLERDFARRAGLGWIGKNTLLIDPQKGSHLLLAGFLTSETFEDDKPFSLDHCGTCTACLDACPTGALLGPRRLDARLCISYLTIETKGPLPADDTLRQQMGNWLLGCDICQDVCPWNKKAARMPLSLLNKALPTIQEPLIRSVDPFWLLEASSKEIQNLVAGRAWERTGESGLRRNAVIVLVHLAKQAKVRDGEVEMASRLEKVLNAWIESNDCAVSEAAQWGIKQLRGLGGLAKA